MDIGIKKGFRSGLEGLLEEQLVESGKKYSYESEKISYIQPEKKRTYTPDFILNKKDGSKMYIESKGRWVLDDRKKHELIHTQYPELDIRFVFSNPNAKISKNSKTTYADVCEKFGWKYAKKYIPIEWINECM
jgi:predicted nuclease of restriction endonuclease-like RecB superfamily